VGFSISDGLVSAESVTENVKLVCRRPRNYFRGAPKVALKIFFLSLVSVTLRRMSHTAVAYLAAIPNTLRRSVGGTLRLPMRVRRWWDGLDVGPTESTSSQARSVAYEALVRQTFGAGQLMDTPARIVPRPFQESFEHTGERFDLEATSFTVDVLGRLGVAVGIALVLLVLLIVCLATGLYAPNSVLSNNSNSANPTQLSLPSVPQLPQPKFCTGPRCKN
jgi:hypothetical protein